MITTILLTSMLISNYAIGKTEARFSDMSDEDFSEFVDAHADMFDTLVEFAVHGDKYQILFERGVIGTATGAAIKLISKSSGSAYLIGGAVEIAKGMYTDLRSSESKDEKIAQMEKQIEALLERVNELERNSLTPTLGDFTSGHGHETRDINTGKDDIRTSVYGLGDRTFTTDPKEAGPHRESYREHREESTREIRDTVDRIYNDAMRDRSNDNYVERR